MVTVIVISFLLPSYKNIDTDYEIGTIWTNEDLIAPFSFPIYKDDREYEKEKAEAIKSVAPVFMESGDLTGEVNDFLKSHSKSLEAVLSKAVQLNKTENGGINSPALNDMKSSISLGFEQPQWEVLFSLYRESGKEKYGIDYNEYISFLQKNILELQKKKIINIEKSTVSSQTISIKKENSKTQTLEETSKIYDRKGILEEFNKRVDGKLSDTTLRAVSKLYANKFILDNLIYSKELTDLEIQNRVEQISRTIGIVRENERIVSKHDPVTRITKLKLDSFKKIKLERMGVQDFLLQYVGKFLTVIVLIYLLGMFLYHIRRDIFNSNLKIALISTLLQLESVFAYLSLHITVGFNVEFLIFVPVAAILLTILFDSRLAFFVTVIICFLTASIRGGDYSIAFISLAGSGLAIFSVRDVKNRSQIFRSAFFILAGYVFAVFAMGFDKNESIMKILGNLALSGVNAFMSPIIAYGLLIFYEKTFRITTDLTLIELADFNHPLLKQLSAKAPGTFHHSVVMGNMSEAAAEAIGANRVLARVGCYYHDVGKLAKPGYFVENQVERKNIHEGLNPNISVKVIIAHVKEGMELARKYKIPPEVIDFIPMHHGTTLVSYFYNKAKNLVDEDKEDIIDYIYRYPGPKPQTKETGIVMLADTIEASTRTIEEPTPKKLEDKIDEVIKKRFIEGELDECELTLKDLTNIKKAFLKILVGIHHQRIKYPEEVKQSTNKTLFEQ